MTTHDTTVACTGPRLWIACVLILAGLWLAGCNGGAEGGATASAQGDQGEVVISLTDAAGEFVAYTVGVRSLRLRRRDGTEVEALPTAPRVDFAQYVELSELLTVATVPAGIYREIVLVLDFTDADIRVDAGDRIVPVSPRDPDGNPLGVESVRLVLEDARALVVRPGTPAMLTLDFDLQRSNRIDLDTVPPIVTVAPVLAAEVDLERFKEQRARGLLAGVDAGGARFALAVRPFHLRSGHFGRITVHVHDQTQFEVDGVPYTGDAGLQALAALPNGAAVIARGRFELIGRRLLADEVYAGTSVPFGDRDAAWGSVVARAGDRLTLRGATLVRSTGAHHFHAEIEVQVGPDTRVVRQRSNRTDLDASAISVGQRLAVLGTWIEGENDAGVLDATAGLARLLISGVRGRVQDTPADPLILDLTHLNGWAVELYDFTGTNSDPSHYRIALGVLSEQGLAPFDPVRVRGFPVPFGSAVTHDFVATTLIRP